jgi:peptidoglycan/LPS O-acetylase OafA/YrhL
MTATPESEHGRSKRATRYQCHRPFVLLDTFRGLAALYVLLFHARGLLGLTHPITSALLQWGVEAVLFFFVLSGFCIHFAQSRALASDNASMLDVRRFAQRRFRRIYPPFAAALVLTSLVDFAGRRTNPAYYDQLQITLGQLTRSLHWDPITFAGNLFCLQPGVPTYGSNGPLWSLSYEAFFYLVYPAYFYFSRTLGPIKTLGVVLAISAFGMGIRYAAGPHWVVPFGFIAYWGMWAFGAALADIASGRIRIRANILTGAFGLILLTLCATNEIRLGSATLVGYAWASAWALLVFWAVLSQDLFARGARRVLSSLSWSARFSYSLYLAHMPVVTLVYAVIAGGMLLRLSPESRFALAIALGLTGGLALYVLVERHFVRPSRAALRLAQAIPEPSLTSDAVTMSSS